MEFHPVWSGRKRLDADQDLVKMVILIIERLMKFIENTIKGEWSVKTDEINVFAHSLGNNLVLDSMRIHQFLNPHQKFFNTFASVEAAVWGETFLPYESYVHTGPDPVIYTVDDLKMHSWAFWFNQPGQETRKAVNHYVHSWNSGDYAVDIGMTFDECYKRNAFSAQYIRQDKEVHSFSKKPKWLPIIKPRLVVNSGYNELDLARETPVLLDRDKNNAGEELAPITTITLLYNNNPMDVFPPLGTEKHPLTLSAGIKNIEATTYGWDPLAHGSGFKGAKDILDSKDTPLSTTWIWFEELVKNKAYKKGTE
ncbi:MAG: hypothetical protein PHY48_14970 [Candidatus Cloacimonetes bacterium]|nr:hypothetical protein [Candidatus Cloacimonadota bacterium]